MKFKNAEAKATVILWFTASLCKNKLC